MLMEKSESGEALQIDQQLQIEQQGSRMERSSFVVLHVQLDVQPVHRSCLPPTSNRVTKLAATTHVGGLFQTHFQL